MLERLERKENATDLEPAFIHDHPAMSQVYYQSTAVVSEETTADGIVTTYRLMFSGTGDESAFRIVDYRFTHDATSGALLGVEPSEPMRVCPAITNDLNTPFISKDGRHVIAYTSDQGGQAYSAGASLKLFEIMATNPAAGTTSCEQVLDFGFAAGKADFSFDGSMVAFHISQGGYLTPFVNGGLDAGTITDVVVARLDRDANGAITGQAGLRRVTTSLEAGVGSYFPAFFPDGSLFYIANSVPKSSEAVPLQGRGPGSGPVAVGRVRDVRSPRGMDDDRVPVGGVVRLRPPGARGGPFPVQGARGGLGDVFTGRGAMPRARRGCSNLHGVGGPLCGRRRVEGRRLGRAARTLRIAPDRLEKRAVAVRVSVAR
jgi:hypothetical protein